MTQQALIVKQEVFNEVTKIMNMPDFQRYGEEVGLLVADCKKVCVTDEATERQAVEKISQIKGLSKRLEEARKGNPILQRYRGVVDAVNNAVRNWTEPLQGAERHLKAEIRKHDAEIEMQRRKEQEIAQRKANKLETKIEKEAAKLGIQAPEIPKQEIPKPSGITRGTGGGKISRRKTWKAKLVDMKRLAKAVSEGKASVGLLIFNQSYANDMARNGERDIPGVEIYPESDISGYAS